MRYISEVDYRKQVSDLLKEIKNTKDPKQQQKLQDEMEYLRKLRVDSALQERMQAMSRERGR